MNQSKRLVEGALFVAIYGIFMLFSRMIGGFLESTLFFILPLPLVLFTYRYGWRQAFVPFVAVAFLAFIINPISALFYVVSGNVLGVVYGNMLRHKVKETGLLVLTASTSLVLNILTTYVFASLLGYNLQEDVASMVTMMSEMLASLGVAANVETLTRMMYEYMPAALLLFAFVEGYMVHWVCTFVLFRLKELSRPATPYVLWQWPRLMAILVVAVFVIYLGLIQVLGPVWAAFNEVRIALQTLMVVGGALMMIQGISSFGLWSIKNNRRGLFLGLMIGGFFFFTAYTILGFLVFGIYASFNDFRGKVLYNNRTN